MITKITIMKRITTFAIIAAAALCAACSKPSYGLGEVPSEDSFTYTVTPDKETPNVIRFSFSGEKVSPFWRVRKPDGSYLESNSREFTLRYYMKGKYDGTLTAYGSGGEGEPVSFTFNVTENDPIVKKLTGDGTQKVWVWNWSVDKHFGEGSLESTEPDWWPVGAWEMKDYSMYDDELSFVTDSWDYILDAKGKIYADGTVLPIFYPDIFKKGSRATVIDYVQPEGQKWAIYADENDKLYLSFSEGGFPSYPAYPTALGGAYEITELTDDVLALRFDTGSADNGAWYYRFVLKGTQPETGGGDKPDKPDQPDTPTMNELEKALTTNADGSQKVWMWDHTNPGHYGEGDANAMEPDWWSVGADEMAAYSMYDDELEFHYEGHAYILRANGYVYCDRGALAAMGHEGNEATNIEYTQPEGQTWGIVNEDGADWLRFSEGAFPSAIPVPQAIGGKFRILSLTDDCLYLRLQTPDDSWYYKFVPKK